MHLLVQAAQSAAPTGSMVGMQATESMPSEPTTVGNPSLKKNNMPSAAGQTGTLDNSYKVGKGKAETNGVQDEGEAGVQNTAEGAKEGTNGDGSPLKNPDTESDDVSDRGDVTATDPNQPTGPNPPDVVSGKCDLREGCLQKDATIKIKPKCANDCYSAQGHGYCLPSERCMCAKGWSGDDCGTPSCQNVGDCFGHGKCIAVDTCACNAGFNGKARDQFWTAEFALAFDGTYKDVEEKRAGADKPPSKQLPSIEGAALKEITTVTKWDDVKETVPVIPDPLKPMRKARRPKKVGEYRQQGNSLVLPAVPEFELKKELEHTIMMWFKTTDKNMKQKSFLAKGNHFHGAGVGVGMMEGGFPYCAIGSDALPFRASNLPVAVSEKSFADSVFHHLTCRFTKVDNSRYPAKIIMLIDGNEVPLRSAHPYTGGKVTYYGELTFTDEIQYEMSEMAQTNAYDYPMVIGGGYDRQGEHFDGMLSDIRIFRRGLKYYEIRSSMWTPMKLAEAAQMQDLVLYLPLGDCRSEKLTAVSNFASVPYIFKIKNWITKCSLAYHPLAGTMNT